MGALSYLNARGLDAENLMDGQLAVWPEEAITTTLELWIIEHKSELIEELRSIDESFLMPWSLFIDDTYDVIMLSPCKTAEDAQSSAQQRWPGKSVKIKRCDHA